MPTKMEIDILEDAFGLSMQARLTTNWLKQAEEKGDDLSRASRLKLGRVVLFRVCVFHINPFVMKRYSAKPSLSYLILHRSLKSLIGLL